MTRGKRKNEHILKSISEYPRQADFSTIDFIHNCLPELDVSDISINIECLGRSLRSPLYINALTGGTKLAEKVNIRLATVAREVNIAMAVGSQRIALQKSQPRRSFRIIRSINPRGIIWSNIGSYVEPDEACRAVEMIKADAIQIHLNVTQELAMGDGDRKFQGVLERISRVKSKVGIPVIVKEIGFGIAREQAKELLTTGIDAIDISGKGGTNFINIENQRCYETKKSAFYAWGIPTAISIIEVQKVIKGKALLFASGGLTNSLDIAKSMALGASMAGMAGLPLYYVLHLGVGALIDRLNVIEKEIRTTMLMVGAKNIQELQQVPLVVTGKFGEWLEKRGHDLSLYANRSINRG